MESHGGFMRVTAGGTPAFTDFNLFAEWKGRAACAGQWELFEAVDLALHPPGQTGPQKRAENEAIIAEAKALCASCPVLDQCHESVVPASQGRETFSFSIIAGKEHYKFHPDWSPSRRDHAGQQLAGSRSEQCPHCGRMFTRQNIRQHIEVHSRENEHGTPAGCLRHRRRRETPCEPCHLAQKAYDSVRKARAKRMKMIQERVASATAV